MMLSSCGRTEKENHRHKGAGASIEIPPPLLFNAPFNTSFFQAVGYL